MRSNSPSLPRRRKAHPQIVEHMGIMSGVILPSTSVVPRMLFAALQSSALNQPSQAHPLHWRQPLPFFISPLSLSRHLLVPSCCIGSIKNVAPGTEEMAQWSKFLPCKHGDLSWISRTIFFFKSENVMWQSSMGGGHATTKQQKA